MAAVRTSRSHLRNAKQQTRPVSVNAFLFEAFCPSAASTTAIEQVNYFNSLGMQVHRVRRPRFSISVRIVSA